MRRIKIAFVILALALTVGSSFSTATSSYYYYRFIGDPGYMSEVMNYTYYVGEFSSCFQSDGDLCGLYLETYMGYGENPNPIEFEQHVYDLWQSAWWQTATDPCIKMQY